MCQCFPIHQMFLRVKITGKMLVWVKITAKILVCVFFGIHLLDFQRYMYALLWHCIGKGDVKAPFVEMNTIVTIYGRRWSIDPSIPVGNYGLNLLLLICYTCSIRWLLTFVALAFQHLIQRYVIKSSWKTNRKSILPWKDDQSTPLKDWIKFAWILNFSNRMKGKHYLKA